MQESTRQVMSLPTSTLVRARAAPPGVLQRFLRRCTWRAWILAVRVEDDSEVCEVLMLVGLKFTALGFWLRQDVEVLLQDLGAGGLER